MIGQLITALINLWYLVQNLWRRLWRRRVDYVRLELHGTLPEFVEPPPLLQRLFMGARRPVGLMGLRRRLQRIADDPHSRGVLLVVRDFEPGWATAEGLRDELRAFQEQGKRVCAYLVTATTRSYFAVSNADDLLMPPQAYLYLLGIRIEARFLRDALCKVGLDAEVIAVSPYKAGGDQFVRSDISPEHREQLERLLHQRFETLVNTVAADRSLTPDQVRALIDQAPFVARQACEVGLIDAVCYEDELAAHLSRQNASQSEGTEEQNQPDVIIREWHEATKALRVPYRRYQRRYVAVVSITGAITTGESRTMPLPLPVIGGRMAGSDSVARALRKVERNPRVAGLVLHIDSPGGDAFASDLIWREVLRVRRQKPVVVSMGNVAASGGYYVAACANAIFAHPGTLTGSIGVYSLRPDAGPLLRRAGVNTVVLSRGARTGLLDGTQPLTDDDRAVLRETVSTSYAAFKQRVRDGRSLSEEQLEPVAGGRVWMGQEARPMGLIDELGGLPAAVARARNLAQLPTDPRAPLLPVSPGSSRRRVPPQPFPAGSLLDLLTLPGLLEEVVRPRILAALPWVLEE